MSENECKRIFNVNQTFTENIDVPSLKTTFCVLVKDVSVMTRTGLPSLSHRLVATDHNTYRGISFHFKLPISSVFPGIKRT